MGQRWRREDGGRRCDSDQAMQRKQVEHETFASIAIYKFGITDSVHNRKNLRGVAKRGVAAGVSLSSEAPRDTVPVSRGCTSVLLKERLTPAATKRMVAIEQFSSHRWIASRSFVSCRSRSRHCIASATVPPTTGETVNSKRQQLHGMSQRLGTDV